MTNYSEYMDTIRYIVIHEALLTESQIAALDLEGVKIVHVFMEDETPSDYLLLKTSRPYADIFKGYKKFTADQVQFVIASIQDEVIQLSDIYVNGGN